MTSVRRSIFAAGVVALALLGGCTAAKSPVATSTTATPSPSSVPLPTATAAVATATATTAISPSPSPHPATASPSMGEMMSWATDLWTVVIPAGWTLNKEGLDGCEERYLSPSDSSYLQIRMRRLTTGEDAASFQQRVWTDLEAGFAPVTLERTEESKIDGASAELRTYRLNQAPVLGYALVIGAWAHDGVAGYIMLMMPGGSDAAPRALFDRIAASMTPRTPADGVPLEMLGLDCY